MLDRLPRALPVAVLMLAGLMAFSLTGGAASTPPAADPVVVSLLPAGPPEEVASRSRAPRPVARLTGLVAPDLMVTASRPLSAAQVARLKRISALTSLTTVSTGRVTLHTPDGATRRLAVMGVDPSAFRRFTPRETASSDALWRAVARGDLASSYASRLALSSTVELGAQSRPARVGALASFGLPDSDLVVSEPVAAELGLQRDTVLLAAPKRLISTLTRDVRAVLGASADVERLRPVAVTHRRPSSYKELYVVSARYCPGLSWTVLAAIGQVESGHGRNLGPSSAGALGPMQFLPSTWAEAGVDGDGDGRADIMSPYDSVPAAALYLCRNGAGRGGQGLYNAIFAYNHADWYVKKVLGLAEAYG